MNYPWKKFVREAYQQFAALEAAVNIGKPRLALLFWGYAVTKQQPDKGVKQ